MAHRDHSTHQAGADRGARDLAFLHVHPIEESFDFAVIYPSLSRYRLCLQFSVIGEVHLAEFTQVVPRAARDRAGW
ncbi:MAG: hypothetical protein H0W97_01000 [Actinobacteria bacterium]|nr:hypothetical protein [Actinomycetota bacterium]